MNKIKKIMPKALSALLSLIILCSSVAVASYSAGAESTGAAVQKNEQKAEKKTDAKATKEKAKSGLSKSETVYVIAKANGEPKKVIVSNWIKNPGKAQKIVDITNLKNIENLKGDESYSINENKAHEWDAKGNDIYYQGEGTTELPVGVSVSYKLNGAPITPEQLAGKSGKVTMNFDYTNRKFETVKINGKPEKIYVPFVMLTGMLLDNEKFKNVEITNGKVINDGNHTYVAGFAMPGLQESLGISKKDFELPSSVEITADATNFELSTTLTIATNEVFSGIDSSKAEGKVNELEKSVNQLADAAKKLSDGTSQLYLGVGTLLNKSGELVDGVNRLNQGAQQLDNGTLSLKNGASKLSDGTESLDSGIGKADSGAGDLNNGAGELSDGAYSLDSGVAKLQGYIAQLKGGLGTISSNSTKLNAGAKQVFNSLLDAANSQIAASGVTAPTLTIDNFDTVLQNLIDSMSKENAEKLAYDTAYKTVSSTVNSQRDVIAAAVEANIRKQVTEGVLAAAGLSMSADEYDSAVAAGSIPDETVAQISAQIGAQMSGMQGTIDSKTDEKIEQMINENMNSDQVKAQIADGVAKADAGRQSLIALKKQLDSYNEFYNGVLSYTAGVDRANTGAQQILSGTNDLKNGSSSLANGAYALKNGTNELKNGTSQLKSGSEQLKDGANALDSGAGELKNGAGQLRDGLGQLSGSMPSLVAGVNQLNNGAMQLDQGMKKFKTDGIDKIKKAIDSDLKPVAQRLKEIKRVSDSYNTYSGAAKGTDSKVNFIFKTDGINTKDDSDSEE